jgi:hypothetical protein
VEGVEAHALIKMKLKLLSGRRRGVRNGKEGPITHPLNELINQFKT